MRQVRGGLLLAVSVVALLSACSGGGTADDTAAAATDTLTRRQKDSLISTLPVPGAGAVGAAQRAADAARARAELLDSLGG